MRAISQSRYGPGVPGKGTVQRVHAVGVVAGRPDVGFSLISRDGTRSLGYHAVGIHPISTDRCPVAVDDLSAVKSVHPEGSVTDGKYRRPVVCHRTSSVGHHAVASGTFGTNGTASVVVDRGASEGVHAVRAVATGYHPAKVLCFRTIRREHPEGTIARGKDVRVALVRGPGPGTVSHHAVGTCTVGPHQTAEVVVNKAAVKGVHAERVVAICNNVGAVHVSRRTRPVGHHAVGTRAFGPHNTAVVSSVGVVYRGSAEGVHAVGVVAGRNDPAKVRSDRTSRSKHAEGAWTCGPNFGPEFVSGRRPGAVSHHTVGTLSVGPHQAAGVVQNSTGVQRVHAEGTVTCRYYVGVVVRHRSGTVGHHARLGVCCYRGLVLPDIIGGGARVERVADIGRIYCCADRNRENKDY